MKQIRKIELNLDEETTFQIPSDCIIISANVEYGSPVLYMIGPEFDPSTTTTTHIAYTFSTDEIIDDEYDMFFSTIKFEDGKIRHIVIKHL